MQLYDDRNNIIKLFEDKIIEPDNFPLNAESEPEESEPEEIELEKFKTKAIWASKNCTKRIWTEKNSIKRVWRKYSRKNKNKKSKIWYKIKKGKD